MPVPDPTKLTTEQLRRELATLREIIETRLDGMDRATEVARSQAAVSRAQIEQIRDRQREETVTQIGQLRKLLEARLDGMDRATEVVSSQAAVSRAQIEQIRDRLREETVTQIGQLRKLLEARLDGMDRAIALQFGERDVRSEQATVSSKQALEAALLAQKELVAQQNDANSAAAAKAEASFTKQIDQIGTIIQTTEKATDARITELKERIDRGEGSTAGATGSRSERAQVTNQVLMAMSVLAAVIGLLIVTFHH
jgi:predicted component of type VI protein secretion system